MVYLMLLNLPIRTISASGFRVYFHSDGSNNDWGFKLTAKARTRVDSSAVSDVTDVNSFPFYLGQTPSYASSLKGAEGSLGHLVLFRSVLTNEQVQALASAEGVTAG
jgi:hypothetical protein